jgi:putative hydrolase of the HAD superfamily
VIDLILFDVGGVLGTNGWDTHEREAAAAHFGLDLAAFEARHDEAVDTWESGHMSLDDYLDFVVFNAPRAFTRQEFRDFMYAQSTAAPDMIAFARRLAATRRWTMMTMNNESAELHAMRVERFGLCDIFSAFLTSCYIGFRKPADAFYDRALAIAYADPARTVFIDDREVNLAPVRARGVHVVHATGVDAVRAGLEALGVTVDAAAAGALSTSQE